MATKQPTGWVGWVYFASAMMVLAGGLQIIAGLVAIFKDDFYVVGQNALIAFNYTTWGWIHFFLGLLILGAGLAVMAGSTWGRVIGVFLAILCAIANVAFLAAYPIWSIIGLVVNGCVIYALTLHGDEV